MGMKEITEKEKKSYLWLTKAAVGAVTAALQPLGLGLAGKMAVAALSSAVGGQLEDYASKNLSNGEKRRVDEAAKQAIDTIEMRLKGGDIPRLDGFFDLNEAGHSQAGEIFEAMLLKVKDEPQQMKARYLANLFANVAFRADISAEMAHHFLKLAERLTFRQYCLLSYIGESGIFNARMLRGPEHKDPELAVLKREEMDLHASDLGTLGLVGGGPWADNLTPMGETFYQALSLNEIPDEELGGFKQLLIRCGYVFD